MSRRYWFGYNGSDGNEGVISNYSLLVTNPGLCAPGTHLCALYAFQEAYSEPPIPEATFFTTNIQSYITAGKASGLPQPTSFPKFVYVKQA